MSKDTKTPMSGKLAEAVVLGMQEKKRKRYCTIGYAKGE